jgi:hypothetical protein
MKSALFIFHLPLIAPSLEGHDLVGWPAVSIPSGISFSFEFGIKRHDVIEADLISKLSGPLLEDAF